MGSVYINNNGNNVKVKKTMININGKWTQPKNEWINVNGVWKKITKDKLSIASYSQVHTIYRPGDYYCPTRMLINYEGSIVPSSSRLYATGYLKCRYESVDNAHDDSFAINRLVVFSGEETSKEPKFSDGPYQTLQTFSMAIGPIVGTEHHNYSTRKSYCGFPGEWVSWDLSDGHISVVPGTNYKFYSVFEVGGRNYMESWAGNIKATFEANNITISDHIIT